jgi:hypothetical protein
MENAQQQLVAPSVADVYSARPLPARLPSVSVSKLTMKPQKKRRALAKSRTRFSKMQASSRQKKTTATTTTTTSLSSDETKIKNAPIFDYLNLSSVLPNKQHSLTVSPSFFNTAYLFPSAEQIASEIITNIQKSCKTQTISKHLTVKILF